jgi:hypothetical protein
MLAATKRTEATQRQRRTTFLPAGPSWGLAAIVHNRPEAEAVLEPAVLAVLLPAGHDFR